VAKKKGGLLSAWGGQGKSRKRAGGLSVLSGFGKRSTRKRGRDFAARALGQTRGGGKKGRGLLSITDKLNEKGEGKKKRGMGFMGYSAYSKLSAEPPPSMRGAGLPDVPVQEGTAEDVNSILIQLRELAQSLPEVPEARPSVWAQFRELMQRLPPLPERSQPVWGILRGWWDARMPAFEAPRPARVWGVIGDYVRSLRPRGKKK